MAALDALKYFGGKITNISEIHAQVVENMSLCR
jgi:hypothetical protein